MPGRNEVRVSKPTQVIEIAAESFADIVAEITAQTVKLDPDYIAIEMRPNVEQAPATFGSPAEEVFFGYYAKVTFTFNELRIALTKAPTE